jgi:hypothetical protein
MVVSVGGGLLLVSWWLVPFAADQAYSTNMGWLNVSTYVQALFPGGDLWAIVLAGMGTVMAVVVAIRNRQSAPLLLAVLGITAALVVRFDPQWTLYNVRFLPFYMLCVYLLAGYFVAEVFIGVAKAVRRLRLALWSDAVATAAAAVTDGTVTDGTVAGPTVSDGMEEPRVPSEVGTVDPARVAWPRPRFGPWAPGAVTVPIVAMLAALVVVLPPLVPWMDSDAGKLLHHTFTPSNVASWAEWNYSGYQNTPGAKELYDGIIPTMQKVGKEYGCGRAMWEYNSSLDRFGTPESLMLLPYWTNNCIDSLEGVLFESSATTPYHFINQAELSAAPSEAVVSATTGIQYGPLDVGLGIQHLQLLGIKYYMASSPETQAQAAADPELTLVATTGPWPSTYTGAVGSTTWKIYEVHDASIVTPLKKTPDVLTDTAAGQGSWLPVAQKWYADPARWDQQLVVGGPAGWDRTATPATPPVGHPLPPVKVTDVKVGIDSLSFHVDRTGVPVMVGISYFPNWQATGATGPWRAEPDMMVVDPTSHQVTLTYGSTSADRVGLVLSLVGLLVLAELVRRRSLQSGWSPLWSRARRRGARERGNGQG